jgi:hypothetical protein
MDINQVVVELDLEIARLKQVRALLAGHSKGYESASGNGTKIAGRRTLSLEARNRIAEAQRKRWAKAKKAAR